MKKFLKQEEWKKMAAFIEMKDCLLPTDAGSQRKVIFIFFSKALMLGFKWSTIPHDHGSSQMVNEQEQNEQEPTSVCFDHQSFPDYHFVVHP